MRNAGIAAAIVVALIVMFAVTSYANTNSSSSSEPAALEGEAADIADFTDCRTLQARFDGWYRNRAA